MTDATPFRRACTAGLALFLSVLAASPAAAQEQEVPVEVAAAVQMDMSPVRWVPGTVIGRSDARIGTEVDGLLETVLEVGDEVRTGDVLAEIDTVRLRLQVAQAEAAVAALEARRVFFASEARRLEKLARDRNAAVNALEQTLSDERETAANLEAARARLLVARDDLERAVIRAPFAGVVTERLRTRGERVQVGDAILRLVDTENLEISAHVPRAHAQLVRRDMPLAISDGDREGSGVVRAIVPVGDDRSRLYELRLSFSDLPWLAGQAVRVAVPEALPRSVVAVPRDALVIRGRDVRVFRVGQDGKAEGLPVEIGVAQGEYVEIPGGVAAGDRVVVRGNERLRPGQVVRVLEDPAPL